MVNGVPFEKFTPQRGLRQGCPLSPYLFILCVETLSSQLTAATQQGLLSGVPIARGMVKMSHLFFADNCLLFCKASVHKWIRLNSILRLYESTSQKYLDRDKTSLFFNKNTGSSTKEYLMEIASLRTSSNMDKNLGLPSLVGPLFGWSIKNCYF